MSMFKPPPAGVVWKLVEGGSSDIIFVAWLWLIIRRSSPNFYSTYYWKRNHKLKNQEMIGKLSDYGHELVAGVSWAPVLLPLKTRRVDEAIPPAVVVVRKKGFQLRCPPCHSTEVQNYEVCYQ
ncbi:hypothetical protein TNCV_3891101 [Trichonephila clavipes]|nr:hypothetical protein TNCV_3891101 [Trichonephila clavipes]